MLPFHVTPQITCPVIRFGYLSECASHEPNALTIRMRRVSIWGGIPPCYWDESYKRALAASGSITANGPPCCERALGESMSMIEGVDRASGRGKGAIPTRSKFSVEKGTLEGV